MPSDDWPLVATIPLGGVLIFLTLLGALVVNRRPDNAVGWILIAIGGLLAAGLFATQYAERALVAQPGSLPGGSIAAWFQTWLWIPIAGALPLLILLFPTGRPPSKRWDVVAWAACAVSVVAAATAAFRPGPYEVFPDVDNPLGNDVIGGLDEIAGDLLFPLIALTTFAAVVSIVVRFRRSQGTERQQLKWFVFAVCCAAALTVTNPIINMATRSNDSYVSALSFFLPLLGLLLLPLAIAASVLRFRLYEIDRLVSRTLSYAIVSAILVGGYSLATLFPSALFGAGAETPDAMVAATTLVAVALVRPLMRRVRRVVDRRFNRSRYDARRTVDTFSARLREQIDIDALNDELRALVSTTMHPRHVSLWLKR
jgi:hypothetical protein